MYGKTKYRWDSKKTFLYNTHTNGLHFAIEGLYNEQIVQQVRFYVDNIIKNQFADRFVDYTLFDKVVGRIDYVGLINEEFGADNT